MVWKQQAERASAQSTGPPEAPQKQFGSSNKKVRQILEAGDWKSAAFLIYLNEVLLHDRVVADAHGAEHISSSSEDRG